MKVTQFVTPGKRITLFATLIALASCAAPETPPPAASTNAPQAQQSFVTPDQAATALADATRQNDKVALLKILGHDAKDIISSGDPAADKESREKFTTAYDQAHKIEADSADKATLVIGEQEWPLPIPLVRDTLGWHFDTDAGREEILDRRIGRNELNVISVCHEYVEAQREYAAQHRTPDGKPEYAQHLVSKPGKHNGLYWPTKPGEPESPFGPLIADARDDGYTKTSQHIMRHPFHGYYFRILKAQGENAAGGAKNYIVNNHMTEGFALIAYPAKYGDSGIMTFIINQTGIVFQKNLGPDTVTQAHQITTYDPDETWGVAVQR